MPLKKTTTQKSSSRPRRLKPAAIERIFEIFQRLNPKPETELSFSDPYTLLVAVTLSAQATDIGVNKATARLFPIAHTPKQMVALGEKKLADHIKTIGLWRNKAKNVIALSKKLLSDFNGEVPNDREALESLPGVGRKTANVVLNIAFHEPTIAVDTHIFRVANRTGIAPGKDVLSVEKALIKSVPDTYKHHAHHWLILHGRYICKARTPECWRCPIEKLCLYKDKTPDPATTKAPTKKQATKTRKSMAKKPKLAKTIRKPTK